MSFYSLCKVSWILLHLLLSYEKSPCVLSFCHLMKRCNVDDFFFHNYIDFRCFFIYISETQIGKIRTFWNIFKVKENFLLWYVICFMMSMFHSILSHNIVYKSLCFFWMVIFIEQWIGGKLGCFNVAIFLVVMCCNTKMKGL